jgi:hypothetical protein
MTTPQGAYLELGAVRTPGPAEVKTLISSEQYTMPPPSAIPIE